MKKLIIFIFLIMGCGCSTIQKQNSMPPLIDSELPFKMSTGTYYSVQGDPYIISTNNPKWCVSEAYLYKSITSETTGFLSDMFNTTNILLMIAVLLGLLSLFHRRRI